MKLIEGALAIPGGLFRLREHDGDGREHLRAGEPGDGLADAVEVVHPGQDQVRADCVRRIAVDGGHRVSLGRARGDGRAFDTEEASLEVDVVQLLAIDEAAGRLVTDDRAVLPAVPQPGDYVDDVGVFGLGVGIGRCRATPEVRGFRVGEGWHGEDPGPAAARVVEGGDRRRDVERLGVRGGDRRNQADPAGDRRDRGQREQRVEPSAHDVGAPRLEGERVVEGDEVERSGFGELRVGQVVAGGEQRGGLDRGYAPSGRVIPGTVDGDAQVQLCGDHARATPRLPRPFPLPPRETARGQKGLGPRRAMSSRRRIRSEIGGCVENSLVSPSPARNGFAIISCDWETSCGSGTNGRARVPATSLRSAEARASGSPVSSAPDAAAWYSRERLTAIRMIPAAIGPTSTRSRLPSGLPSRLLPPKNSAMFASTPITLASAPATQEIRMSRL